MRAFLVSPRGLVLLAATTGLAIGCQQKNQPAPTDAGGAPAPVAAPVPTIRPVPAVPPAPAPAAGPKGSAEDPDVAAYFRSKGWTVMRDKRIADGKALTYLIVNNLSNANDYKMIGRAKGIDALDMRNANATDDGLKAIAANTHLQAIIVKGEGVTDAGVKSLAGCKTLDSITLFQTEKVTDAGVKELAALPNLQVLHLAFLALNGSAFEAFAGSKSLRFVDLDYVDGFTDDGAKSLAKLPALDELKIKPGFRGSKLTAAGIKAIVDARLPAKFEFDKKLIDDALFESLVAHGWLYGPSPAQAREKKPATPADVQSLILDDSKVSDRGFAKVLNCTNVVTLYLKKTGITDETLKKLPAFKKLEYLSLDSTKVTGAGLEALAGLPLNTLSLEGCELSEDAFKALGKIPTLESLNLTQSKMKAEWLKHISTLPKLKFLNLRNAEFNDAAASTVVALQGLESLTLNGTSLGNPGFQELVKLPKLKTLYVDGTQVTKDAYQKAKKEHPKLSLYFYKYDQ